MMASRLGRQSRMLLGRSHLPAARRQFSSSRNIWRDGTLEFAVGGTLIGALAVDQLLQYKQNQQKQDFMNRVKNESPSKADLEELEEWFNMPSKFRCIVRKLPSNLDGTKVLKGVEVGDVVDILEEKVGPENMYNLCRTTNDNKRPMSAGWFPTMYLEKKTHE